jgi:hypothetical protein
MPLVTHSPNISIDIVLDAAPVESAGFGTVLLAVPQAQNSLNSERVAEYASVDEATAANTAGYISASTLAAITAAFSQTPRPESVKVGRVDLVGGETYASAIALIRAVDDDWYVYCVTTRTAADQTAVITAIEAIDKVCVLQSGDATLLTGALPAALSGYASAKHTAIVYHDTAAEWADVAWAVSRSVWDPDVTSAAWTGEVAGVNAYATALTSAQRTNLQAIHVNVGLPYGSADFYVDAGKNGEGRPLYEIVTKHWFAARVREDVIEEKLNHDARGAKIPVTTTGQAKIKAIVDARLEQGVAAGHFVAGEIETTMPEITDDDRDNERIRIEGRAQIAVSGRIFDFDLNFGRDPLE